jgi:DNA-binding NarL/FixJ family response regulator
MRIMVIDGSEIFRIGLRAVLTAQRPDIEAAEESDRMEVERVARAAPDVLLVDLEVPGGSVVLTGGLKKLIPATRVVISCDHSSRAVVQQALNAGASGYIVKSQPVPRILGALDRAFAGETVVQLDSGGVVRSHAGATGAPPKGSIACLSQREREVFDLVVWGASNKDIASTLGISVKTVETHRCHINAKLGVHSAADMVRVASYLGVFGRRPPPAPEPELLVPPMGVQAGLGSGEAPPQ